MTDTPQPPAQFSLPSWTLPALMALLGGGGAGYLGRDLTADQQPAVLSLAVDNLRQSQQGMEARIMGAIDDLREDVDANREIANAGARDRFTRGDHSTWVAGTFEARVKRIEERLTDHEGLPAHPSAEARYSELSRRIEQLERRGR